jgi:hypothetical protein
MSKAKTKPKSKIKSEFQDELNLALDLEEEGKIVPFPEGTIMHCEESGLLVASRKTTISYMSGWIGKPMSESTFNRLEVEPCGKRGKVVYYHIPAVQIAYLTRENMRSRTLKHLANVSHDAAFAAAEKMAVEEVRKLWQ